MKEKYESPHKQSWMRVSSIFLDRVGGGGRTVRKFRKGCTSL